MYVLRGCKMKIDLELYLDLLQKEYYAMKDHIAALEQIRAESPAIRQGGSVKPIDVDASKIAPEHYEMVERAIIRPTNRTLDFLNKQ